MDITLGELKRLPIKRLKEILKKLNKEELSADILYRIGFIKGLIKDKKKNVTIVHPGFVKTKEGLVREKKCLPVHLI